MTPESQLKRDVADDMKRARIMFVRVNSGKVKVRGGWVKLADAGTPDFLGLLNWSEMIDTTGLQGHVFMPGRAFAVETKATHKDSCKCSSCEAQRGFRRDWEARGGLYILARKREDVWSGLGIQIEGRKAG